MRISAWQQFSSNHSADFTVVGVFESPEAAQKAADEVRRILKAIQEWYKNPANEPVLAVMEEEADEEGLAPPTPIEIEFGKQYGFEWTEPAPDALWYLESKDVSKAVAVLDHTIFIESYLTGERTWSGKSPVAALIEKLGGSAFMQDGMDVERFWLKLTCVASDEQTANSIERAFNAAQDSDDEILRQQIPREFWFSGKLNRNRLELEFRIEEVYSLSENLPVMLSYLQKQGCAHIEYQPVKGRP